MPTVKAIQVKCSENESRPRPEAPRGNSNLSRAQAALAQATAAGDKAPWGRAKLMVVGQGRAGKTSTVRRLLGQGFDEEEASTVGANTEQQFSVDLSRTVNGFVEVDPAKEDFVRRQVAKLARMRYQSGGNVKQAKEEAGAVTDLKLPAWHKEVMEEEAEEESGDVEKGRTSVLPPRLEDAKQDVEEESLEELDVARRYSEGIYGTIMEGGEETRVQLTIWDYGGQRVFYALHHLFLTEYGVYTLVFDMREVLKNEDDAVEYLQFWLKSIALHAPSAPIVLVGTYRDVVGDSKWKPIDTVLRDRVNVVAEYTEQLIPNGDNDLTFFPVDNRNDNGLTDVQEAILVALTDKPFMQYPVPLSWISCLDELLHTETSTTGFLHLQEVEKIARKHRVKETSEVRLMLSFFHEIGSLFYFYRSKNLRDIVIVDTQWLVDALTCLIFDNDIHTSSIFSLPKSLRADEEMFMNTGVLSERLRKEKWKNGAYPPDIQQKLLSLMEDMLLLCKWPWHERQGAVLVPSILLSERSLKTLAEKQAVEDVRKLKGPSCEIDFGSSFLPDGLFQRLVCLCATFSEIFSDESQDPPTVRGRAALIDFGEAVTFGMQYVVAENKIVLAVAEEESRPGAAPKLVKHLNSMLEALKDDFMGRNLVWQLNLNSSARPELFVAYERLLDARKVQKQKPAFKFKKKRHNVNDFDVWFASEGAAALGDLRKEDTDDLVEYEQNVKQHGPSYALQQVSLRTERKELPSGLSFHCYISYKQVGGSEIALTLFFLLASMGYIPWFDQSRDEINGKVMLNGVRDAAVYILVLSKDVFKSGAVLKEARKAKQLKKPIIAVYESDPRRQEGYCSFDEYLYTVPEDLQELFNEEEALPHQRRFYLLRATIQEIDRRIMKRMH